MKQTSVPTTPGAQNTYYDYYTDDNPNDTPDYYGYGQLKQIVYPDGYWEKRQYWVYGYWIQALYPAECILIHPYINSQGSGSTSVTNADPSMCEQDEMYLYDPNNPQEGQATMSFDYGNLTKAVNGWNLDDGTLGDGHVMMNQSAIVSYNSEDDLGYTSELYANDAPVGLAGHSFMERPDIARKYFYYDYGTYNQESKTFVIDPLNHVFVSPVPTNNPDWRRTELFQADPDANDNVFIAEEDLGVNPGDSYTSILDHQMYISLRRNISRKTESVYHGGNLVQTVNYVYTGPNSTNWSVINSTQYGYDSLGHVTNATLLDPVTQQSRILSITQITREAAQVTVNCSFPRPMRKAAQSIMRMTAYKERS